MVGGCGGQTTDALQPLDQNSFAAPPQTMIIKIQNYQPQPGKTFQNLFVANSSVVVKKGQLRLSQSRDGMADILKQSLVPTYGFAIDSAESAVKGFGDQLLFKLGITISQQNLLYCSGLQMVSSSNDAFIYNDDRAAGSPPQFLGLRDCEKNHIGLNVKSFDFDNDGIPDYLEMMCGLNPMNKSDAFLSTAADGVANIDKCKRHIPIDEDANSQPNHLFAYQYSTILNMDGSSEFTVKNISILDEGKENFISIYITETDASGGAPVLATAFAILKAGYAGKTLNVAYWGSDPYKLNNQQVVVP